MRKLGLILCLTFFGIALLPSDPCVGQSRKKTTEQKWPGEHSQWNGFERHDFQVDGRAAYVVEPESAAPGNPWVFRARFPDFHARADLVLLERGFHIARINTDGMLGSPRAMQHWNKFYSMVIKKGLAQRAALEGVSRGGLFVYNFASRWPDRVACIYCDTPVCDIKSWPGGKGIGIGHPATWELCLKEYGLTEETVPNFRASPIDILQPIAMANIPVLHIVSLTDKVVPPTENTFVLADRYRALGGSMDIIEVAEGTEESSGHHFTHPDPVRIADFIERHATVLPDKADYFKLRGSLDNCRVKFEQQKVGRVAFMGGSITEMQGWRDLTKEYLTERFPETTFDFVHAGIASTGSTPGAFRLMRDVFSKGDIDLLFEEAAVNDLHNGRKPHEMTRGMEGILRHARTVNPNLDIVVMHFVDPNHMNDYRAGKSPSVIEQHEKVANHYHISTIQLAKEVTERIDAKQFDWANDFRDLHPSPYGHRVYASTIRRLFSTGWETPLVRDAKMVSHELPEPLDRFSYAGGKMVPLESAEAESGFKIVPDCDPRADQVGGDVRPRFHNVPMLVGTKPGDTFSLKFKGTAVGLFVAAGPDAGMIEYLIDGTNWKTVDLFTRWSRGLHIPWVYILEGELEAGDHEITIRIIEAKNEASTGHACRIVDLLVNESPAE